MIITGENTFGPEMQPVKIGAVTTSGSQQSEIQIKKIIEDLEKYIKETLNKFEGKDNDFALQENMINQVTETLQRIWSSENDKSGDKINFNLILSKDKRYIEIVPNNFYTYLTANGIRVTWEESLSGEVKSNIGVTYLWKDNKGYFIPPVPMEHVNIKLTASPLPEENEQINVDNTNDPKN